MGDLQLRHANLEPTSNKNNLRKMCLRMPRPFNHYTKRTNLKGREHGEFDYFLTEILYGHGGFRA